MYVINILKTSISQAFDYVNFFSKEDAGRAIMNLNGLGYENLVSWRGGNCLSKVLVIPDP